MGFELRDLKKFLYFILLIFPALKLYIFKVYNDVIQQMVIAAMKLKDAYSLEGKL